jgi:hypothetical protein
MREIRQSGSEGGGAETNRLSLPLFPEFSHSLCRGWYSRSLPFPSW